MNEQKENTTASANEVSTHKQKRATKQEVELKMNENVLKYKKLLFGQTLRAFF